MKLSSLVSTSRIRESFRMEMGRRYLFLLAALLLQIQGSVGVIEVQVTPRHVIVNPGDSIRFMCKVIQDGNVINGGLDTCTFKLARGSFSLRQGKGTTDIKYDGAGLDKGQCGVLIENINEKDNGNVTCSMALTSSDPTEYTGTMAITVTFAPQKPELDVTVESKNKQEVYRERDTLTATCTVRDGRPTANITWFLGDDLITEGLRMPVETCTPQKKDLCTIQQNMTRTLQANDDKKVLKCVANHMAFKDGEEVAEYAINVNYPPKALKPFEIFGLIEGTVGRVPVTIEANPQPAVIWTISGDTIYENSANGRYSVEPTKLKSPGVYESVLLINGLTKEDTEKQYEVKAHNSVGQEKYTVFLSTSPEPKVLEMGTTMILIVAAIIILLLLAVGGVLYSRSKGKFCFASVLDVQRNTGGECSDTESAEQSTKPKTKTNYVAAIFKKKPADKEVLKEEGQIMSPLDTGDNVVYAELDLGARSTGPAIVRGDDDKTEYAEIIHTKPAPK